MVPDFQARPDPPQEVSLLGSVEKAAVAELAYIDHEGRLSVLPVTPVNFGGEPAFTLTYADAELARHLEENPKACLTLSDSRLAYAGWGPLSVSVTLEVTADLTGELYCDGLLHQELRKYPPGRKLANSFLLRREHWWYLPRFIFLLKPESEVRTVGRKASPENAVLAWRERNLIVSETVRTDSMHGDETKEFRRIGVEPLRGRELPSGVQAVLHYHDFSIPDMEQRSSRVASGRLDGGRVGIERVSGDAGSLKPAGLLARWREHRSFKSRCLKHIEAYERGM